MTEQGAESYQDPSQFSTNGAKKEHYREPVGNFKRIPRDTKNEVGDVNVCRVYICHLPYAFTSADLLKMFSPYGKIIESKVLVDPRTGKSRGVAFIHYERKEDAQTAITAVNGTKLDNHHQTLQARFARVTTEGKDRPRSRRRDPYDREPERRRRRRRDDDYDDYDDDYDRRPRGAGIRGSGYYDPNKNRGGYTVYTAPGARVPPPPLTPSDRYPPSSDRYPPSSDRYPPSSDRYPPSSDRYPPSSDRYPPSSSDRYPPPSSSYSSSSYPPSGGGSYPHDYNPYGRSSYAPY